MTVLMFVLLVAAPAAADTIYLRDGSTVRGTVLGFIGGRFAIRVTTTTPPTATTSSTRPEEEGEVRFIRPRDIERVEIDGRSLEEARFQSRTVDVSLGPNWIDSGVDLRRGERVQVRASGTIVAGRTRITPDGLRSTDPTAPVPRAAEGVLIGAVGNDPEAPIMELGSGREFVADRDGRLYLTANRGTYTDARGAFNVQVRTERNFDLRRDSTAANRNRNRTNDEDEFDLFGGDTRTDPAPARPRNTGGRTTGREPLGDRPREPREVTVNVPGDSQGIDTGIDLRTGDQVTINATGTIVAGQRAGSVSPNGGRGGFIANPRYPMPQAGVGALVGVIRTPQGQQTEAFLVGSQLVFTSQVDGRLFLLVNDDNYSDNSGQFNVRIRY
jgi:hypothetical protein